jgi:hypothetical protein
LLHFEGVGVDKSPEGYLRRSPEMFLQWSTQHLKHLLCGDNNRALYGACLASTGKKLELQLEFTEPIYPGLVFSVTVSKVDFYNQTVSSDSSTFLKFHTMPAASSNSSIVPSLAAEVSGDAVFQLVGGLLKVDLALLPYFSVIRADSGLILHAGDVVLYAEGLDDLSSIILRCPFSSL